MDELKEFLQTALSDEIIKVYTSNDELTLVISPSSIIRVLSFLKEDGHCLFRQLIDICGADYPHVMPRFEVIYHLLSHKLNQRIRVKVKTDIERPVPSVCELFPNADWWERETWDLFGIKFTGHPDLRRILTDYGFEGHPLQKDFPLTGYVEVRYDEKQKKVAYEAVQLQQDFRNFDFLSPWEGQNILPGDEKAE